MPASTRMGRGSRGVSSPVGPSGEVAGKDSGSAPAHAEFGDDAKPAEPVTPDGVTRHTGQSTGGYASSGMQFPLNR